MGHKFGRMSDEEEKILSEKYGKIPDKDLAKELNRTVDFVRKFGERTLRKNIVRDNYNFAHNIHASAAWAELQKILMPEEIPYFEQQWGAYLAQFSNGSDILATDEMMIRDLIVLDIFANRAAADRMNITKEISDIQRQIDAERQKEPEDRDRALLSTLNERMNGLRTAVKSLTDVHIEYQTRKDSKLKDLKATREQRFKQITESRNNIFELIRELDTKKNREEEGKLMAKFKVSVDQTLKSLGQNHEYFDGTIDKPFLSPEGEEEDSNNE